MAEPNPNARLETFCDGVFAIAMTLLIIDIKLPATAEINSPAAMWHAFGEIFPSMLAFVLSFIIIFITWVNHHNALKLASKSSPAFFYANGLLLLSVVFIPFPTSLIGEYIFTDAAGPVVALYNLVLILQSFGWVFICTAGLRDHLAISEKVIKEIRKNRIYAWYSVLGYSILAVLAIWFPLPVIIFTMLLWILWLVFGINIEHRVKE